jgi:hypothetical protein
MVDFMLNETEQPHSISIKPISNWAMNEFGMIDFGDKRLSTRLLKLVDSFVKCPESSINKACETWSETKAAYRFFKNDNINENKILNTHIAKTIVRASEYKTILAIQDTCYISYKNHKKTTGLGVIASRIRSKNTNFQTKGLIMHTAFAITTDGLALGLLDQKINARPELSEEIKELKKRTHNRALPIENKESIRWLKSLTKSNNPKLESTNVVTVCDREGDIYELFELACREKNSVLIRASQDRIVNKKSIYPEKTGQRLWDVAKSFNCQGEITVTIPTKNGMPARKAVLEIKFGDFIMNPSKNNVNNKIKDFQNLKLNLIYVVEKDAPETVESLEWLLLTNLDVNNFEEALEKVKWYGLRWRIEVFHKILKSGLKVEECRLQTADKLIRYLTVMSIIAWRIFFITLIARADPTLPCNKILAPEEWRVLYSKINATNNYPPNPPTIKEAVLWIAKLGGFLGRKNDGDPGPITLWRGWRRLFDLVEGWNLALSFAT